MTDKIIRKYQLIWDDRERKPIAKTLINTVERINFCEVLKRFLATLNKRKKINAMVIIKNPFIH